MRHTISVLVKNEFGVLARVSGLFSGRGYNIDSLSVAVTKDPAYSRMTIVTRGNDQIIAQITKQLNKLIPVISVVDMTEMKHLVRELILIKVPVTSKTRQEILTLISLFSGKILDNSEDGLTVEFVGFESQIEAIVNSFKPYGIIELTRSGHVATPSLEGGAVPRKSPVRKGGGPRVLIPDVPNDI